jgi:hypothetical protein
MRFEGEGGAGDAGSGRRRRWMRSRGGCSRWEKGLTSGPELSVTGKKRKKGREGEVGPQRLTGRKRELGPAVNTGRSKGVGPREERWAGGERRERLG